MQEASIWVSWAGSQQGSLRPTVVRFWRDTKAGLQNDARTHQNPSYTKLIYQDLPTYTTRPRGPSVLGERLGYGSSQRRVWLGFSCTYYSAHWFISMAISTLTLIAALETPNLKPLKALTLNPTP